MIIRLKLHHTLLTLLWLVSSLGITSAYAIYGNQDRDYLREFARIFYPYPPAFVLKDGLYFGISAGYDAARFRESTRVIDATGAIMNPPLAVNGWMGNIFLGYGRAFDWFYMGGEVYLSASDANSGYALTAPQSDYRLKLQMNNSWGADILPGILLNQATLFYLRLGFIRTYLHSDERLHYLAVRQHVVNTPATNAYRVGLGLESVIYCNLSLRGDYTYASYSAYFTRLDNRFSPANHEVTLALLYHLNL